MTHKDFINSVQKMCQLDHSQCSMLLNALCRLMSQAGVEQVPVTVPGLGTFTSHKHPEYIQEDPATGQQTLCPPRISYRMQAEEDAEQAALLERQLAEHAHVPVDESASFISALSQVIYGALDRGEEVEVHGLGTFHVVASHQGLPRVAYTPDDAMREAVNAPFNCFEPVAIKSSNAAVADVAVAPAEDNAEAVDEDDAAEAVAPAVAVAEVAPAAVAVPVAAEAPDAPVSAEAPVAPVAAEAPVASVAKEDSEAAPVAASLSSDATTSRDKHTTPVSRPERHNQSLIRFLVALIVLCIVALGWFIYQLDDSPDTTTETVADDAEQLALLDEDPNGDASSTEVFFSDSIANGDSAATAAADPSAIDRDATSAAPEAGHSAAASSQASVIATSSQASATASSQASVIAASSQASAAASSQASTPAPSISASTTAAKSSSQPVVDKSARLKNADGSAATHTLQKGERLTLVALKYYGDKSFWPYIYEVNQDKLKSPSLVQAGMKLYLPDPKYFGIDAANPASVRKAKDKAAAILKAAQ